MPAHRLAAVRRPFFATRPADEAFLDSAPLRLSETFAIARPASGVWAQMTADDALHWCRILGGVTWTTPRPFGVGTERSVKVLGGAAVFRERFFRWEDGRRHSFMVTATSVPAFRRFAEDVLVEPDGETACRMTWTIAVEPQPALAVGDPLNRRILSTLFTDTRRHFAAA